LQIAFSESIFHLGGGVKTILLSVLLLPLSLAAQTQITEEAYTPDRSAANLNETILNTSNVATSNFGKLFSYTVDASIFAQPLYVPNVAIAGAGTHNVVYVATMANSIYALDADTSQPALWYENFGLGVTTQTETNIPLYGIMSTPYIDLPNFRMYFVTYTTESGADVYRLHVLDIRSGVELMPSTVISGTSSGATFDPAIQMQRPGLAFANGQIIIAFGSFGDYYTWHGWIFSYNNTLTQTGAICTTPTAIGGGLWASGRAPVVDSSGNIYFQTGNGIYDGTSNYADSFIKLNTSLNGQNGLTLADWFTPSDYASLDAVDEDLGSSGPLMIPGTTTLAGAGKEGAIYLVNSGNMGHEITGNSQIIQTFSDGGTGFFSGGVFSGGAFYNRSGSPTYYLWPNDFPLQAYEFNGATLNQTPIAHSAFPAQASSYAASLAVSANGNTAGTGIVWAAMPDTAGDRAGNEDAAILMALDAGSLNELWNSSTKTTDSPGLWAKFRSPVVTNGKVYVGSIAAASGPPATLSVYGISCSVEVTNVFVKLTPGAPPAPAVLILSVN
jgi:hypothetical protein